MPLIQLIKLNDLDSIVAMLPILMKENLNVIILTNLGYIKKIDYDTLAIKGKRQLKLMSLKSADKVVSATLVHGNQYIIVGTR